jgi:excisionase family DNA binding protein
LSEPPIGSLRVDLEEAELAKKALFSIVEPDEDGEERMVWVLVPRERAPRPATSPASFAEAAHLDTKSLLTAGEVAEMLNVNTSWVHRYAREGKLPSIQLGRYHRFRRGSVLAWLDEQES